ncbi:hypothetical protein [Luteitalea sp. TBR-22]|uniref:hypothetical protein n=1 Tax=Luteitalea sp. TBR-22 TaxID=2802971 RepID=UPI001EF50FB8|nr:hypothetical protein [Luteitalea sp. TBR-22]
MSIPALKLPIKRGALLAAANWPVVVVQFIAEATFKILLAVPIVGGTFLVALALNQDVQDVLGDDLDLRRSATGVATSLLEHPVALASFLAALAVVVAGGSALMFILKGGTLSVLVEAQRHAGPVERYPVRLALLRRASRTDVDVFLSGTRRLRRRFLRLGAFLLATYVVSGGLYLAVVVAGYRAVGEEGFLVGWTVIAAICSAALVAWLAIVNTGYLVLQIIIAASDVSVRTAAREAVRLLRTDTNRTLGVFLVTAGLVGVATLASLVATAGLGLISFVPFVGLTVLPLQLVAWLVRGLVFQYLGLASAGAYLFLYEVPADDAAAPALSQGVPA